MTASSAFFIQLLRYAPTQDTLAVTILK